MLQTYVIELTFAIKNIVFSPYAFMFELQPNTLFRNVGVLSVFQAAFTGLKNLRCERNQPQIARTFDRNVSRPDLIFIR